MRQGTVGAVEWECRLFAEIFPPFHYSLYFVLDWHALSLTSQQQKKKREMVVLHLPRFHFSILTPPPSLFLRPHSIPLANNPKFATKSFLFSALKSTLTTSEPIPISHALPPEETHVELPLEKLFVPPETDVPVDSASLSARILKGSNIVVSKYASESQVLQADFVKSSVRTEDCPSDGLPEFALVGRSNVGKSSLLNSLVRRKKLALTSKKPGKTQCINHFRINDSWYLVDLPGYGYAAAPQELRMDWENFTKDYFLNRSTLVSVFLLIDASIPAKQIDLDYACWLGQNQVEWRHVSPLLNKWIRHCISGWTNCALKPLDVDESPLLKIPMTLIFTKCDKRKKKKNGGKRPEENVNDFQELIRGFFETVPPWIMTSSVTNQGRDEILLHMAQLRNYWLKH